MVEGGEYTRIISITSTGSVIRLKRIILFKIKRPLMKILYDPCVSGCLQAYYARTQYVNFNGDGFSLGSSSFVPVGFNAYWLGYTENYDYPPKAQVDEMFSAAVAMGATVIRSHTIGFSSGSEKSLRPYDNNLNENAWEPIDYAINKAYETGVKLIVPMTDSYSYYHGNYGDFCNTRGVDKTEFWTNSDVRNDFKDYLSQWLNHENRYNGIKNKDSTAIFAIELGNELGNIRDGAGSTTVPTREWLDDISQYIKSIDSNHLLMPGTDEALGGDTSDDFSVPGFDLFSGHFYGNDYQRVDFGADGSVATGRGYIIGEHSSRFGQDWYDNIESRDTVMGSVVWSFYPHDDGTPNGIRVPHDDGFTLWYDGQAVVGDGQADENSELVSRLKNHYSAMKNRVR
jgi:mannan endo-1,4-beta-mannosidase